MSDEKTKTTFCPNCHQPAQRHGNVVTCEACDAEYTITQRDGARVKTKGRLDSIEERLDKIESLLPGDEPESDEELTEKPEGDEDDIL